MDRRRAVYLSRKDGPELEEFLKRIRSMLARHRIEFEYTTGTDASEGWRRIARESINSLRDYDKAVLFTTRGLMTRLLDVPDFPEFLRHPAYAASKLIAGDVIVYSEELKPLMRRFFDFEPDKEYRPLVTKYRDIKICVNVRGAKKGAK